MKLQNNQSFKPLWSHLGPAHSNVLLRASPLKTDNGRLADKLSEFFDSHTPAEFSGKLSIILQAYSANDYYRQSSPSDVLFTMEKLSDLVTAAHMICRNTLFNPSANKSKITNLQTQTGSYNDIADFFEHQPLKRWQETIKHITFFALCKDNPVDAGYCHDTLFVFNSFSKLVVACFDILRELRTQDIASDPR
ncbi:hypothetical protein DSL64_02815 [Dyadobacter luteus]|uniref:Uncharacterized protein n=1 Tax=Dyadobacter luteus TaxID=2259619 RepID=A0A3D8YIE1_9BACT|nr:hypothetical protein [Dyadobacter luteus]REA64495.1 hypothetical protein DSL64_02815 [Dyadobacter luteus]